MPPRAEGRRRFVPRSGEPGQKADGRQLVSGRLRRLAGNSSWPDTNRGQPSADPGTVSSHLGRLPTTIRTGLAILGFFGLADVVAHLGAPTGPRPGSADAGQFVAHLGVLVGMVAVMAGVVRDGVRTGRASRTTGGSSGRPPGHAERSRRPEPSSTRSRGREAHDAIR